MSGGVSILSGGGNVDLDSIIKGGDQYMARVKEFREAQAAAEDAREKLGIAKDVIAMRDHAARAIEQAKEESAALKNNALQEAQRAQTALNEWVQQTRTATATDRETARQLRAEAEKANLDAKTALAAANAKHAEASDRLAKATAAHEAVLAAASALSKAVS
jgi:hypothetical protein